MNANHVRHEFLVAIFAAAITACSPAARAAEPLVAEDAAAAAPAGYGAAFGRIVVIEDGKEKDLSGGLFGIAELNLRLRSVATGETQLIGVKGDGSFHWPMKPGEYVIASLHYEAKSVRVWMSFSVAQPGLAVYVGDLRIESERGGVRFRVLDEYETALQRPVRPLADAPKARFTRVIRGACKCTMHEGCLRARQR